MPAVAAAAVAVGGALTTGATTVLSGSALGGGLGGAILAATAKVGIGVALSVGSRALLPQQDPRGPSGVKLNLEFGENTPANLILGKYLTAGDRLYHNAWGESGDTPNEYYSHVVELADWPCSLSRVWINGEYATLGETEDPGGRGYPVEGYEDNDRSRLFVKFYDGTQTVADPYLVAKFGSDPERPWTSDMIGRGMCYAIVTAGWRPEVHIKRPEVRFEIIGKWYDRRKDSTAGGSGSHRWNNPSTWEATHNPVVMIDNILRGIHDPITDEFIWGGQGITNRNLPASVWFAAMNECDVEVDLDGGGTEPQFRAGVDVSVDREPSSVIEELLATCQGSMAQVAGEWLIRVGAPGASVYAFTDDDVVTAPETFEPFPGLDQAFNAINAQYPEPDEGWSAKDAPPRSDADYLDEDGGRVNTANITYSACPYAFQVQRLMQSALDDGRRFRLHNFVLPYEARKLSPLDVVTWTSERNGYSSKQFEVVLTQDLPDGTVAVVLREIDPDDYSWGSDQELPPAINEPSRPGRTLDTTNFSVAASYAKDASGNQRRPDITVTYGAKSGIERVEYQIRLLADTSEEPVTGIAPAAEAGGTFRINSVLPATDYEVRCRYRPGRNRPWSDWMGVTTLNIGFIEADLAQQIRDKLDQGIAVSAAASSDAQAALTKSNELEDQLDSLSQDTLDQLEAITDELAGIDTGSIQEFRGIAIASLREGWVANPAFSEWTGSLPDDWNASLGGYATESDQGYLGSAILIDTPVGGSEVSLIARSNVAGEMPEADHKADYVVVGARMVFLSGAIDGGFLQAQWRRTSDNAWINGEAFGVTAAIGTLDAQWGFEVDPNNAQDKQVVFKRPNITSDAVRLRFVPHPNAAAALSVRVDYLDLRAATEPEIKAFNANEYADAAVTTLEQTITGPSGAIASAQDTVRAEFAAADAIVQTSVNAVATDVSSLAGQITAVESISGENNFVKNPAFSDGVRGAGEKPNYWAFWSSEFSVEARGGGGNVSDEAPAQFYGVIQNTAATVQALAHGPVKVEPSDRVAFGMDVAGFGLNIDVEVGLRIRWLDAGQNFLSSTTVFERVQSQTWGPIREERSPPNGCAYYELYVRRNSNQSANPVAFTNVYSRIVDAVAYARAEEALTTATDAESSIAGWRAAVESEYTGFNNFINSTVTTSATASQALATATDAESSFSTIDSIVKADFAGWGAFVSAGQQALATADQAASAYVIRTTAGGGGATFGIYSWDDEDGSGSAIKLDGDQVIVPGTLSAQTIVVTDLGQNIVPDPQMVSDFVWPANSEFTRRAKSKDDASSAGEVLWTHSQGPDIRETTASQRFRVFPGLRLACSFEACGAPGANYRAGAQLRFEDNDGNYVDVRRVGDWIDNSGSQVRSSSSVIEVPAGAYKAHWRWQVDGSATGNNVRFFAPEAIKQYDGNILITPNSITGAQLVTTEVLIAESAQIGELTVATSNIKNNAVSDDATAYTAGEMFIDGGSIDDQWYEIQRLTINKERGSPIKVTALGQIRALADGTADMWYDIELRDDSNGNLLSSARLGRFGSYEDFVIEYWWLSNWTGARDVYVRIKFQENAGGNGAQDTYVRRRMISAQTPATLKK